MAAINDILVHLVLPWHTDLICIINEHLALLQNVFGDDNVFLNGVISITFRFQGGIQKCFRALKSKTS